MPKIAIIRIKSAINSVFWRNFAKTKNIFSEFCTKLRILAKIILKASTFCSKIVIEKFKEQNYA